MRFISVIEDKKYLLWQQEIQFRHMKERGFECISVILYEDSISDYALELSKIGKVFFFKNDSPVKRYVPSNKAWGLYKLLQLDPDFGKDFTLIDSDVLCFSFPRVTPGMNSAADCDSYLGYNYLRQHLTDEQITYVSEGITTLEKIKDMKGSGAQYYFHNITSQDCYEVAINSDKIYKKVKEMEINHGSKIQVWTAEMWAWLWTIGSKDTIHITPELDFSWATSRLEEQPRKKFLHLAGVTGKDMGIFYKGLYTSSTPWEDRNIEYIKNRDNCGWLYYLELCRLKGLTP